MTLYRNVASLIVAVMLLQAAAGILTVSTPLALDAMGASAFGVGLVAAMFACGFMAGAWFAPDVVRQVGHIRAYSAGAAIYAAGILGMGLGFDPVIWACLRLVQGVASAVMFASAESWIADSTPVKARGSVMGLYQLMLKIAMSLGPLLVVDHAPQDMTPFVWGGLLMVLGVVPLCATRRAQPVLPDREALSLTSMLKIPPAALAGCLAAGVVNQGVMSQLPLYAKWLSPMEAQVAATSVTLAAWIGGIVTQWPAGLLSDRIDRRLVVAGLGALACGSSLALFLMGGAAPFSVTVLICALWGAGALSFYSVSAAYATDRTDNGRIAQVMSGMLFVWAGGSILGPIICGVIADTPLGQPGIFAYAALGYAGLVIANLWRLARTGFVAPHPKAKFQAVGATSVVQGEIAQPTKTD